MNRKIAINFDWKYAPDFEENYLSSAFDDAAFAAVNLPHTNIELPYNNFDEGLYGFESCYRKQIWIDELEIGEQVAVQFDGVANYAKVYLNGGFAGEHKGGYTPFQVDLTPLVNPGGYNLLAVYVDARERDDIPPFGFVVDYLTYGGIYREVSLLYRNHIRFGEVCVKTINVLTPKPVLDVDLYAHNASGAPRTLQCRFDLFFEGECVKTFCRPIEMSGRAREKLNVREEVEGIALWSIEKPNLYHMELKLIEEGKTIDLHRVRFGFRQAEFRVEGFYLNGEKLKLRGLNRHQSFPYVGYAMPKNVQYKDAELLKRELGVNAVRASHYPQSDHFLDRCDELGLLVLDEIPGWQHIGDQAWQDLAVQTVGEMILKDFNHPSVILWGVRINESQDHDELYARTNALAKELDDTRSTGGVRCIAKSRLLEDVYTYNDFLHKGDNRGLQKKKRVTNTNKPYLITEHNGHMFPTKKFDDEVHRVEHALRHLNVLEAMYKDDKIAGAIGWCMFDYNTHKDFGSGDKICYHGVLDMFRIPKHAAYAYASQQAETPVMHVAGPLAPGDFAGSTLPGVYVFTNCDSVKLYKNGEFVGEFYPSKERYPHVPFPPVIIDDFIGGLLEKNERFSPSDARIIKRILIEAGRTNGVLGLTDQLKMGWLFLKYKMNMLDAEALYAKYFGGWGAKATDYVFEGYRGGQCVITQSKGQLLAPALKMEADADTLTEGETYDAARIVLRLADESGNDIVYANDAVALEAEGPIEIIGPRTIALIGGSVGFWVKSTGKAGEGRITIKSERFGTIEKTIRVIR
ncbi:MAG: glycoside hydrolase family 2 protein [Eubacteriales bacterium]|nr:glycoside hydrolase family 2 protein [Eubacteriales bacterium]